MRYVRFIFCCLFLILATGCITQTPSSTDSTLQQGIEEIGDNGNNSPVPLTSGAPLTTQTESVQNLIYEKEGSAFDSIQITIHNITVMQKSGSKFPVVVFNISLINEGLNEPFFLDDRSLVCFQSDFETTYPKLDDPTMNITNPILLHGIGPGEQIVGEVGFFLNEHVDSLALYVRDPNWTILGGVYIPDMDNITQITSDREYPKNLTLSVPSAVQKATIPGANLRPGHKIAIINVSITNHNPTDVTIQREQLLLLTERGMTLEHGGSRLTPEMAREYLRFPLTIHPGETKTGPVFIIVYSGTRTNKLALTDKNFVIQSLIDLNGIYRYE